MDNAVAVALATFLEKNSNKKGLTPGSHKVDSIVKVHVKGTITKGEDETYIPTVKIPIIPALILCLKKAGLQRENILDSLFDCMKEALENETKPEITETLKDIQNVEYSLLETLKCLPPATRSGKTLVNVSIEEI